MSGKTERVTFRCAPSGAALVRAWAEVEDVPLSTAWRRVMKAGIVALGLQGGLPSVADVEQAVSQMGASEQPSAVMARIDKIVAAKLQAPRKAPLRLPATVWTGAVDADGYPMPEEGQ